MRCWSKPTRRQPAAVNRARRRPLRDGGCGPAGVACWPQAASLVVRFQRSQICPPKRDANVRIGPPVPFPTFGPLQQALIRYSLLRRRRTVRPNAGNRIIKKAAVRRDPCDVDRQFEAHCADLVSATNFGRGLQASQRPHGLQLISRCWTKSQNFQAQPDPSMPN